MATKPTELPEWAKSDKIDPDSGENNVNSPTSAQKNFGYSSPKQYPARQAWNWLGRALTNWVAWFNQQEQTHTAQISSLDMQLLATDAKASQAAAKAEANRLKNVEQDNEIAVLDTRVTAVEAFIGSPIGSIVPYFGDEASLAASAGDSWLVCDGSAFDQAAYPGLLLHFSNIGKPNPATLPNLSGYTVIGVGGYTDASGSYNYALGDTVGTAKHKLTEDELAAHSHGATGKTTPGQNDPFAFYLDKGTYDATYETDETGGDGYHENRQPSFALTYIIKAK